MSERPPGPGGDARARPEVEVVTIGDELLLGETVDGNAAWLGRTLAASGIRVSARATVGDDPPAIREAAARSLERTGTVLCTGGLGPTLDDVTKPVLADLFGRPLVLDDEVLDHIRRRFETRGLPMPDINRGQAEVPEGATVFMNPRGTAPGLALEDEGGRVAILLPGVPAEMRVLVEGQVLPYLERRWPEGRRPIVHRVLRTTGIPESALAERVDDIVRDLPGLGVAFLPSTTGVDLRLTSWGALPPGEAEAALDAALERLRARVGSAVYTVGTEGLTEVVGRILRERGLTLAVAESCTGGLLGKRLTDVPGSSEYFVGGVIAYADDAKVSMLGVRPETLAATGAVSGETAREMAEGARVRLGAGAALAITGVAGPGGGTEEKPVGTVWVAAATAEGSRAEHRRFAGDRGEVRDRSAQAALELLRRTLTREGA